MKREVAGGAPGNFRRVCPILNWAAAIDADIFRHLKYIENADLPIDRDLYFG